MYLKHRYGLGYETLCSARTLVEQLERARVADTAEGFAKAKRSGMQLHSVYGDRGFGTSTGDAALTKHRFRDPVIPRQQRAAPIEQTRSWASKSFRNGLEGRVSH